MGVKIKNRMETRYIELSLDTAKRWYEQGGELKDMALGAYSEQELIDYRLPKTWEEYRKMKGDEGEKANAALNFAYTSINSAFPDYHDAEKHIALMKLHLLRDEYRRGWKPDWINVDESKFVIEMVANELSINNYGITRHSLSFQDEKTANEFLTNFRELIKEAGDLI